MAVHHGVVLRALAVAVALAACGGDTTTVAASEDPTSTATPTATSTAPSTDTPSGTSLRSATASPTSTASAPGAPSEPLRFVDALEPDRATWLQPYGVDVTADGSTWVLDAGNHRLVKFDAGGSPVAEVGGQGSDPGQLDTLGFGALAVGPDDEVFVVDNGNGRIQVFADDGSFLRAWGEPGDGEGMFRRAIGIAVDDDGQVYVTDDERPEVQVFDRQGTYLRSFGEAGDGPGGIVHATGIDVDADGNAWVADFEARRLQVFDADGAFVVAHEIPGPIGTTGTPEGVVVLDDGRVWVTSYRDGEVLQVVPRPPDTEAPDDPEPWPLVAGGEGTGDGTFTAPVDLAVAPDGTLVVTDQSTNTVQRFRPAG